MKNGCDCVCHKLGYVYCAEGWCPDHGKTTEVTN